MENNSKTITLLCDGTASYKLKAEPFDRDFDGVYVLAQYFGCSSSEDLTSKVRALAESGRIIINGFLPDGNNIDEQFGKVQHALKAAGTKVILTLDETGLASSMALEVPRGFIVKAGDESGLEEGTMAISVTRQDGTHYFPAQRLDGFLLNGKDHEKYVFRDLSGTTHFLDDANMFNRAFAVQNRPGGYVNAQTKFRLNEDGAYKISAWFVPGTLNTDRPMIIGFTSGSSARPRLAAAIAFAENVAAGAVVAPSRAAAGEGNDWVEEESTLTALKDAIAAARASLDNARLTSSEIDGAVYELHLALWGSLHDISAVFLGNAVPGFYDIANPDQEKEPPVQLRR